jgi:hypothetical protein
MRDSTFGKIYTLLEIVPLIPDLLHHTGHVFDYAVRGECSDGYTRSNTDRHQKVCLWDVSLMRTVDSGFDIACILSVVFSQGAA